MSACDSTIKLGRECKHVFVGGTRHAFGDQYRATDLVVPGAGKVELVYTPEGGGPPERHVIHDFDAAGVVMGMYNTEASIRGFAKACFEYALDRQWCGSSTLRLMAMAVTLREVMP